MKIYLLYEKSCFFQYTFEASFLEIYNENIRDLLGPSGQKDDVKHEIKMVSAKKGADVSVTNLTSIEVTNYDQVQKKTYLLTLIFSLNTYHHLKL